MSDQSKQQVIAGAAQAFRKLGPTCSMSEVADHIGVPRRWMYRHIEDLYALKNAVTEWHLQAMEALATNESKTSLISRLQQLLDVVFDVEMCGIAPTSELSDDYFEVRDSILQKLLEEGRTRHLIDAPADSQAAAAVCFYVLDNYASEIKLDDWMIGTARKRRWDRIPQTGRSTASIVRFSELFGRVLGYASSGVGSGRERKVVGRSRRGVDVVSGHSISA